MYNINLLLVGVIAKTRQPLVWKYFCRTFTCQRKKSVWTLSAFFSFCFTIFVLPALRPFLNQPFLHSPLTSLGELFFQSVCQTSKSGSQKTFFASFYIFFHFFCFHQNLSSALTLPMARYFLSIVFSSKINYFIFWNFHCFLQVH